MTTKNASCIGVNHVLALKLPKEFLDQKLNEPGDDEKFNYCRWDSKDQVILTNSTATYEECK